MKIVTAKDFETDEPLFAKPKGGTGSYVMRHGRLVPKWQVNEYNDKRSDLPSPYVIPDVPEHRNMATGEIVSTRPKHKEILRRFNLVEVGNEGMAGNRPDRGPKPGEVAADIKETIEKLEAGYVDPDEGFYPEGHVEDHTITQSSDDVVFDAPEVDLSANPAVPQYSRANGSAK